MAMIMIAPKSSITANAVNRTLRDAGTRLPKRERMPIANAISVAIGMPPPDCVGVP